MPLKETLRTLYLHTPSPVSKWAYSIARSRLFIDRRAPLFDQVFHNISTSVVEGDYLEFGVFRGTSFINAYRLARKCGLNDMRFFAFDSFHGLPQSEGKSMKKGRFASSRQVFDTMIRKAGVDCSRVVTVEGFYKESLTDRAKKEFGLTSAAIVHIDCDLYSSAKEALVFIEDLVHAGTILIFDDWYAFRNDRGDIEMFGERRAFREWPLCDRFHPFYDLTNVSKAFIMK